jgi:hypothetical protein
MEIVSYSDKAVKKITVEKYVPLTFYSIAVSHDSCIFPPFTICTEEHVGEIVQENYI